MSVETRRGKTLEELQPDYDDPTRQPKTLTKSRHIDDVFYVAGRSPKDREEYDIMFITVSTEEEEATTQAKSHFGFRVNEPAEYLKGSTGLIKDVAMRVHLDLDDCYYTAVCKWVLPRAQRAKPSKKIMRWGLPIVEDEIERVKPKIIVCMGKPVFDLLYPENVKFADAHGCWFWSEQYNAHMYVMHAPYTLIGKPDFYETFRVDFREIMRRKELLDAGEDITGEKINFQVIDNEQDLLDWLSHLEELANGCVEAQGADEWPGRRDENGNPLLSVDCEWHGKTHVDGELRTMQVAWSDTDAVVIEFLDEEKNWSFQLDSEPWDYERDIALFCQYGKPDKSVTIQQATYAAAGKPIASAFKRMNARFIGHHFAADAPWMQFWLGIDTYEKCELDTEFAQQTCDESSELGLERGIAMKYTNLGRYDQALVMWKRDNKEKCRDGYGYIPSSILHPYACLAWDSKVQLGDGSWRQINELVQERYDGEVMSLVGGEVKPCRVTNWKKTKKVGQRWFRVVTPTTRSNARGYTGPRFTEDHEILTERGYVRVDRLLLGEDRIATSDLAFNSAQRQVVLGSLLGDGGIYQPNGAGMRLRFSQYGRRRDYARWKRDMLSNVLSLHEYQTPPKDGRGGGISFEAGNHAGVANLCAEFPRSASSGGHFAISDKILNELGDLGLAVWFMDDGIRQGQQARIVRTSASPEEVEAGMAYFTNRFGRGVKWYESNGAFVFTRGAFYRLMDAIKPHIHPCMSYKHVEGDDIVEPPALDWSTSGVVYEPIIDVVAADRGPKSQKMDCFRYCLTVPEAGNFLTKAGFVSNCKDVIAPYRAYPLIKRQLEAQQLWEYYRDIFNPFVTDVFTEFCMTGLPMDIPMMDELRDLFSWAKDVLNKKLQERIARDAVEKFKQMVVKEFGITALGKMIDLPKERQVESPNAPVSECYHIASTVNKLIEGREGDILSNTIKQWLSDKGEMKEVPRWNKYIDHLVESPAFNIRSPDQMARWLFDFEGLTPIKSTNQKAKGLPSMAWEKVLELPKERQELYKPAVDKQTLSILAEQCDAIEQLMDLNAVGNLSKAFLKEPDISIDPETGLEVVSENGLHSWLCGDKRIHGQMSATETGRPRSWAPNTLNYPSYVNKRIARTIETCVKEAHEEGDLPEHLLQWVDEDKSIPSIRACIKAMEGWILVESDYATAEMVALAVISGDEALMSLLFDPDPEWAYLKPGHPSGAGVVRVAFSGEKATGIPESASNPDFIMNVWENGEKLAEVTEDDLLRDEDGNVIHAKFDIHWSLIERTYGKCREMMNAKVDRAAAKVLNFSSAYGASAASLERKIESDTGVKPEEGTGERGLEAIAARQPVATAFLEKMARVPKEKGFHRAASGRIRHCLTHSAGSGVGWRTRNSIDSALGREMRNFPMQESVGATSARACKWLLDVYKKMNLKARPMTCLYDSVVTLCPLEERFLVARLHEICMSELNTWEYEDERGRRVLQYTIDNDFNYRWSTIPPKEELDILKDRSHHPPSPKMNLMEKSPHLKQMVKQMLSTAP